MSPFLFGYHISFCYFYALKVLRGHDFWPHLEMFPEWSDLFPLILNNRTVSGEIDTYVALMPVVLKFGTID